LSLTTGTVFASFFFVILAPFIVFGLSDCKEAEEKTDGLGNNT
jgi:hypothetical protein